MKTAQHLLATLAAVIVYLLPLPTQAETFEQTRAKAEQGDTEAQFQVGACYMDGNGVIKNDVEAVKWYRKAADQGHGIAQFRLGAIHYSLGRGVEKNHTLAYQWCLLAGFNEPEGEGREIIKAMISMIEQGITAEQREEGQRLATEWQAAFQKRQAQK